LKTAERAFWTSGRCKSGFGFSDLIYTQYVKCSGFKLIVVNSPASTLKRPGVTADWETLSNECFESRCPRYGSDHLPGFSPILSRAHPEISSTTTLNDEQFIPRKNDCPLLLLNPHKYDRGIFVT